MGVIMQVIDHYSEYMFMRSSRQDVISWAENAVIGVHSFLDTPNISIIRIDFTQINIYSLMYRNEKIAIESFDEQVSHLINPEIQELMNTKTINWWRCVFLLKDDEYKYDSAYDSLKISDDSSLTFEELLGHLNSIVSQWDLVHDSLVFIDGTYRSFIPLLYTIQHVAHCKVRTIPLLKQNENIINGNAMVCEPKFLNNHCLNLSDLLQLQKLYCDGNINVTVPMDDMTLNSFAVDHVRWKQLVPNQQADYYIGEVAYKKISLSISIDIFQNVFLNVTDETLDFKNVLLSTKFPVKDKVDTESSLPSYDQQKVNVTLENTEKKENPQIQHSNLNSKLKEYLLWNGVKVKLYLSKDIMRDVPVEEIAKKITEIEDLLAFDICMTDTNIWLWCRDKGAEGVRMFYYNMLLSLVDLYKEKSHIFELHGAAYEELNKFATRHEDGAYEKYKDKVYKPGNQKKEQTRINARAAKRIISKLKSEDKIRLPHLKGKENLHAYADEHIYGAVENAIKSGKRVLLITNDIDLSIRCMSIKDNFIDDQGALNFPSPVVCQGNLINMLTLHHRLLKEELKSRKLETSDLLN